MNKKIVLITIVLVLLIIGIPTVYKVINKHYENVYKSIEGKIIYSAKKCVFDGKCSKDKITLKELYEFNYLEEVADPKTKEVYNNESYVEINNNTYKFIIKE